MKTSPAYRQVSPALLEPRAERTATGAHHVRRRSAKLNRAVGQCHALRHASLSAHRFKHTHRREESRPVRSKRERVARADLGERVRAAQRHRRGIAVPANADHERQIRGRGRGGDEHVAGGRDRQGVVDAHDFERSLTGDLRLDRLRAAHIVDARFVRHHGGFRKFAARSYREIHEGRLESPRLSTFQRDHHRGPLAGAQCDSIPGTNRDEQLRRTSGRRTRQHRARHGRCQRQRLTRRGGMIDRKTRSGLFAHRDRTGAHNRARPSRRAKRSSSGPPPGTTTVARQREQSRSRVIGWEAFRR